MKKQDNVKVGNNLPAVVWGVVMFFALVTALGIVNGFAPGERIMRAVMGTVQLVVADEQPQSPVVPTISWDLVRAYKSPVPKEVFVPILERIGDLPMEAVPEPTSTGIASAQ